MAVDQPTNDTPAEGAELAVRAWTEATEALAVTKAHLEAAHRLRANAVRVMLDAGMTWDEVEEVTGLPRLQLERMVGEF